MTPDGLLDHRPSRDVFLRAAVLVGVLTAAAVGGIWGSEARAQTYDGNVDVTPDDVFNVNDTGYRPVKTGSNPLIDERSTASAHPINTRSATGTSYDVGALESTGDAIPVELTNASLSYRAGDAPGDARVKISWTTAQETNNAGFTVERQRPDASSWTIVERVRGAGTTARPQSYTAVDEAPAARPELAYRLLQHDVSGTTAVLDTLRIERQYTETRVTPAPQPNPDRLRIVVTNAAARDGDGPVRVTATLYDLTGRRVARPVDDAYDEGRHSVRIGNVLDGLAGGPYLLRTQVGTQTHTDKVVTLQ